MEQPPVSEAGAGCPSTSSGADSAGITLGTTSITRSASSWRRGRGRRHRGDERRAEARDEPRRSGGVEDAGAPIGRSAEQQDPCEQAPAPAEAARKILESVFDRELSPEKLGLPTSAMHGGYETSSGAALRPASRRSPALASTTRGDVRTDGRPTADPEPPVRTVPGR